MRRTSGFTVIELLVVIAFLATAAIVLLFQLRSFNNETLNAQKRTAINSMYYSLEEGFYKKNGYYPEEITKDNLTTIDPELLKDPSGVMVGQPTSSYRYETRDCKDGKCAAYTLRTELDGEAEFIKESRHR